MGWVTELPEGHPYGSGELDPRPVAGITVLLQALADPVRLALVRELAECKGPRPCNSFVQTVTKSTLSHHFKVLREAGVIAQRVDGTRKLTSLRRDDLDAAYPGLLESVLQAPFAEVPVG